MSNTQFATNIYRLIKPKTPVDVDVIIDILILMGVQLFPDKDPRAKTLVEEHPEMFEKIPSPTHVFIIPPPTKDTIN